MAKVLGRVTDALDSPRGPDVLHRIVVAREWLDEGAAVEFELPRNVTCAACEGGGCDRCERAGAFSLRRRDEPAELVQVTLPAHGRSQGPPSSGRPALMLRIPEKGGLPPAGSDLPRGVLLLRIVPGETADTGVRRAAGDVLAPASEPGAVPARRTSRSVQIVAVLVVLWILFLVFLRVTGRG